MKQRSNMPAAKLLIEFYFLRRGSLFLVSTATKRQMWVAGGAGPAVGVGLGWGALCDRLCVDTRQKTDRGLVERASSPPLTTTTTTTLLLSILPSESRGVDGGGGCGGVITLTTADHPVPGCYFMVSAAKYSPLSKI